MIDWRHVGRAAGGGAIAVTLLLASSALPATAEPETPVTYPSGSSATRVSGLGFDTCAAPSLSALRAWRESPYRTVNIYIGGRNRACGQANLTTGWVRDATALGWKLLPTYVGYQPYCVRASGLHEFSASNASSRGTSDAQDAIAKAKQLGLLPGSALYADVEHYDRNSSTCRAAVQRYVSAWTKTLHAAGYLAGVYVHHSSGLRDLSGTYNSTSYARPDAVWVARWDGSQSLTGFSTSPNSHWAIWQRAKQYRGDHNETWGGVTINIDSDSLRAPVATVARRYTVTSRTSLYARSGPGTSYSAVRSHAPGTALSVVCQAGGQKVTTSSVWNRLSNGTWVSDYYVSTPSSTGFTSALPRCMYPGQITASALNARSGPGASYPVSGSALPRGSLAYVVCQKSGTKVGTSSVWNQLPDGRWVSDYYVSNRSNTSWSNPVPRCP
jgi:uncharacterized protein YraI